MADTGILWTPEELVQATGGVLTAEPAMALTGIAIDSRAVAQGDIFVAIQGDRLDGHGFVAGALGKEAGLAIVSRPDEAMRAAGPLLVVDDPLAALADMARAARARSSAQIIAVTGSVGKTSTKDALALALAASGKTHASVSSFNNHWGVPLSLARLPRDAAFGVFEIGMNHSGEIIPLVALVQPHIGIITEIAPSHLGHFNSLDEIADAKAELFTGIVPGGVAVLNRDTPYYDRLADAAHVAGIERLVTFGGHANADVRLLHADTDAQGSDLDINLMGQKIRFRLGVPGLHMARNALAVLAAVSLSGADVAAAAQALEQARPPAGRGVQSTHTLKDGGTLVLVDESYNANPASMVAAFGLLSQVAGPSGRRVAVLGDMLELGVHSAQLHQDLAASILEQNINLVHACGPMMAGLWNLLPRERQGMWAATAQELAEPVLQSLRNGDTVMVKGSLGSRTGTIVNAIKQALPPVSKG